MCALSRRTPYSHGEDGLGNHFFPKPLLRASNQFAPDLILDLVDKYPGEISIAALGPLTNIALALMKRPESAGNIKEIVLTGGAFGFNEYAYRNATGDNPVSEWNIYVDPEAADIVFGSGVKVTAVGLDVAYNPGINLIDEDYAMLRSFSTKEAEFVLDIAEFCRERSFDSGSGIIDAVTMAGLIEPDLFTVQQISVGVERTSRLSLGQTVWDRRDHFRWDNLHKIGAVSDIDGRGAILTIVQAMR